MNTKTIPSASNLSTAINFGVTASVDRVGLCSFTAYGIATGAVGMFQEKLSAWLKKNQPTVLVGRQKLSVKLTDIDILRNNTGAMKSLFSDSWNNLFIDKLAAKPATIAIVKGESVAKSELSDSDIKARVVRAMITDAPKLKEEDGVSEAYAEYFSDQKKKRGTFFRDMERRLLARLLSDDSEKNTVEKGAHPNHLPLLDGLKKDLEKAVGRLVTANSKKKVSKTQFEFCTKEIKSCIGRLEAKLSSSK